MHIVHVAIASSAMQYQNGIRHFLRATYTAASRQLTRQWGDTEALDANAFLTKLKMISARSADVERARSHTHAAHTVGIAWLVARHCVCTSRTHFSVVVVFRLFYRTCTRFPKSTDNRNISGTIRYGSSVPIPTRTHSF